MEWPMEEIRRLAFTTVARACAFAMLAVACMMVGLSYDPAAAFRLGGLLSLLLSTVLIVKGRSARSLDHRRTELWLYLDKGSRPQEAIARVLVGSALREAYFTFARYSAACAAVMLACSLALHLAGG